MVSGAVIVALVCVEVEDSDQGKGLEPVQAVGKHGRGAVLAEDGTECHLENKKGLCVVAGGGWGVRADRPAVPESTGRNSQSQPALVQLQLVHRPSLPD